MNDTATRPAPSLIAEKVHRRAHADARPERDPIGGPRGYRFPLPIGTGFRIDGDASPDCVWRPTGFQHGRAVAATAGIDGFDIVPLVHGRTIGTAGYRRDGSPILIGADYIVLAAFRAGEGTATAAVECDGFAFVSDDGETAAAGAALLAAALS